MPLDSSSTLGGVGGGVLTQSVPPGRADATKGPSTPASSLLQKAAENTIGSHNNFEHRQLQRRRRTGALTVDNDAAAIHRAPLCHKGSTALIVIK